MTAPTAEMVSERHAAALRAALVLLDRVGDAAVFYLTFHAPYPDQPPAANAMVCARGGRGETTGPDTDAVRLADLRAAVAAANATFTEFHEYDDRASITARVVIDGVEIDLWAPLEDLEDRETIAAARVLVPAAEPTGAAA
ncbi:hypothetical protein FF36_00157 [Frankia torreyi]|uniref:Uncharacterized protein n=2 Tax=Frankia torreyi TaxID=1856 RepID=A0A0D8BN24_9ACTN|nr:hypothetical protein FF36_00157 [Frankia torreyi]